MNPQPAFQEFLHWWHFAERKIDIWCRILLGS